MNKVDKFARHRARKLALQALYQWHMADTDLIKLDTQYTLGANPKKVDIEYLQMLIHGIGQKTDELDTLFKPFFDRDAEQVGPIELTALRIATYEFKHRPEIPYKVIINEALELAKIYGPEQSHKYINGILDQVARQLRRTEIQ